MTEESSARLIASCLRFYERALAISRLQDMIRNERSKFIDQYGFLTEGENRILKDTIGYN